MKILITILISMMLFSCTDKHLDEKVYIGKDFTVRWYRVSEITTVNDYIDLERWGYTSNIMNSNTDGIYDVTINADTITIKTKHNLMIYDLVTMKHGCVIKLDSTISTYEYMKKFQPGNAQYYINDTIK